MRNFQLPEPIITLDMVFAWGPCYDRQTVMQLANGAEEMCVFDLLDLPISDADKLWLVLRPEVIGERACHELACDVAEMALNKIEAPDSRSLRAIAVKRAWILGRATDADRAAARAAASAAAWEVERSAAWAASAAAWEVERSAAWAACAAAWEVESAAARSAAWAAWAAARAAESAVERAAACAAACAAERTAERAAQVAAVRSRILGHGDGRR